MPLSYLNLPDILFYRIQDSIKSFAKAVRLSCVFCDVDSVSSPQTEFEIHPFVPETFSEVAIYICTVCKKNWESFRDKAKKMKRLMFPDEENEEICAVCSDTPETDLVLCSGCPKSFCNPCLLRVLSVHDIEKMRKHDNWFCMCCHNNTKRSSVKEKEKEKDASTLAPGRRRKRDKSTEDCSLRRLSEELSHPKETSKKSGSNEKKDYVKRNKSGKPSEGNRNILLTPTITVT